GSYRRRAQGGRQGHHWRAARSERCRLASATLRILLEAVLPASDVVIELNDVTRLYTLGGVAVRALDGVSLTSRRWPPFAASASASFSRASIFWRGPARSRTLPCRFSMRLPARPGAPRGRS